MTSCSSWSFSLGWRAATAVLAALLLWLPVAAQESAWREIAGGLELGTFKLDLDTPVGDSTVVVLRIDPTEWELDLLSVKTTTDGKGMTARQWRTSQGLVAAINAGMFATDYSTHIGLMACDGDTNNPNANHYRSVAAFKPRREGVAPFRFFDLDEDSIGNIRKDYRCLVQNLRLVKRPGENRWAPQDKRWSEAALGEDSAGNILFIFSRSPYSMHDLNKALLRLPIALVAAQHLEGGPEAQLSVSLGDFDLELFGSYETNFNETDLNATAWPIPNVLGIHPRSAE